MTSNNDANHKLLKRFEGKNIWVLAHEIPLRINIIHSDSLVKIIHVDEIHNTVSFNKIELGFGYEDFGNILTYLSNVLFGACDYYAKEFCTDIDKLLISNPIECYTTNELQEIIPI